MNSFKTRLTQDKALFGLWSTLSSPNVAELIGDAGFDWLLFDTEHAPVEVPDLISLLRAANGSTSEIAVRVAWNDQVLIKRVLDLGVSTLFVPFVQTPDEARQAVAATRYPPNGNRGVAGATRASRYGRDKSYILEADNRLCLVAQVETLQAVECLEDIANVEGIDGVFIGPSDLSASMGFPGQTDHPEVQVVLKSCAERLRSVGMPAGILANSEVAAKRYADWGFIFIAASVDTTLLVRATDDLLEKLRS